MEFRWALGQTKPSAGRPFPCARGEPYPALSPSETGVTDGVDRKQQLTTQRGVGRVAAVAERVSYRP